MFLFLYDRSSSLHEANREPNEEDLVSISKYIKIPAAEKPIITRLREQHLLSRELILKVNPLLQCPQEWPLGWKLFMMVAIDTLRDPVNIDGE
jgi:hypothetical protein